MDGQQDKLFGHHGKTEHGRKGKHGREAHHLAEHAALTLVVARNLCHYRLCHLRHRSAEKRIGHGVPFVGLRKASHSLYGVEASEDEHKDVAVERVDN